jgi:hypothetical protein
MEVDKSVTEQLAADAIAAHSAKYAAPVEPEPVPPVDYKALYEAKIEETDRLNAVITAGRIAASASATCCVVGSVLRALSTFV